MSSLRLGKIIHRNFFGAHKYYSQARNLVASCLLSWQGCEYRWDFCLCNHFTNVAEQQVRLEKCLKYAWTLLSGHSRVWGLVEFVQRKQLMFSLKTWMLGCFFPSWERFMGPFSPHFLAYGMLISCLLLNSEAASYAPFFSTQLCWASCQIKSPIGLWFLNSQPLVSFLAVFLNSCKHCVFLWLSDFLFIFSGTVLHQFFPLH